MADTGVMDHDTLPNMVERTVDHLAGRWAGANTRLLRHVFPLLAAGHPVSVDAIARASGSTVTEVESALARARADRDRQGRVIELSGLALTPSVHRLEVDDVVLFACCALFAQLVPQLLQRSVRVQSLDPITRRPSDLAITPRGVEGARPESTVAGMVPTRAFEPGEPLAATFCTQVNYFAGPDTAERWTERSSGRYVLPVADVFRAAASLYRTVWADSGESSAAPT